MDKPSIIVFTTSYHPFIGGAEIAIHEVAKRNNKRLDFFIITSRFSTDVPKEEIRPEGKIIRVGFGSRFDKFLLPFLGCFEGYRILRTRGCAVIWGMDISQGSLGGAMLALFFRLPFIFSVQYGESEKKIAYGRFGLINAAFRIMLSRASLVAAESNYLFELVKKYGYRGVAEVVPNGVDIEKFKAQSAKRKTDGHTVITVSRLVYKNGIDTLISAVAEVKKTIPDIQCMIIGDGAERNNLELKIRNLKLEHNIKLFGHVPHDDIPQYLAMADVFVRPSRSEGMGNSFIEALAAGLPIIGTPVGGIKDIIKDRQTGIFANVDDPFDLSKKIIELLTNSTLADVLVKNGRTMIEKQFSWGRIADRYGRIFSQMSMQPLRVLIATPLFLPDIGGPATYSNMLSEELPRHNFKINIVSFGAVRHLPKIFRHVVYFLRVCIAGHISDIIFAQDPVSVGFPAALAAKIFRRRFILKIVGDYAWEQGVQRFGVHELLDEFLKKKYGWIIEFLRLLQKFTATSAEQIIVPSHYLKEVVGQWGIDSKRINVIYNAFSAPEGKISNQDARDALGLNGHIILSAGRLVPWKGFETLIDIMPYILQHIPDAKLVIVGSGPCERRLKNKIMEQRLEHCIIMTGSISESKLLRFMRAADIFLLNTGYEGFSHILLQAIAMSLPIITTPVGGNTEMIQHGVNGLLVAYNDRKELEHAVVRLLTDHALKEALRSGAEISLKKFTKEKMVNETIKILRFKRYAKF